jgi:hypothetical protein
LSFSIDDTYGIRLVQHGGGTVGQISTFVVVPARDFAFAILTNANRGSQLVREVTQWLLQEYLDTEAPNPTAIDSSEDELSAFVGHYERPFADLDLGMLGGRLIGLHRYKKGFPTEDAPPPPDSPPLSLARCASDRLLVLDGPYQHMTADAVYTEDGSLNWIRFGGRLFRKADT